MGAAIRRGFDFLVRQGRKLGRIDFEDEPRREVVGIMQLLGLVHSAQAVQTSNLLISTISSRLRPKLPCCPLGGGVNVALLKILPPGYCNP